MIKLITATCLILTTVALTIIFAYLNSITMMTIIYRVLISIIVFGLLGVVLGTYIEKFLNSINKEVNFKGKNVDIFSESISSKDEFSPFTPNNFEKISTNK